MRNLITDVPGVLVGNAQDARAATGATVAVFDGGAVAGVATLGGAPGSRGATLLEPEMLDGKIDAVVLSGGSLFGLDAAGGATSVLAQLYQLGGWNRYFEVVRDEKSERYQGPVGGERV